MIFLNAITSYLIFVVPVILIFLPFGLKINSIPAIKIQKFLSKIKNASTWVDDTPEGWICGRWYIGYIKVTTSNYGDKDKNITLFVKNEVIIIKKLEDSAVNSSGVIPRDGNIIRITIKPIPIHNIDNTHK